MCIKFILSLNSYLIQQLFLHFVNSVIFNDKQNKTKKKAHVAVSLLDYYLISPAPTIGLRVSSACVYSAAHQ